MAAKLSALILALFAVASVLALLGLVHVGNRAALAVMADWGAAAWPAIVEIPPPPADYCFDPATPAPAAAAQALQEPIAPGTYRAAHAWLHPTCVAGPDPDMRLSGADIVVGERCPGDLRGPPPAWRDPRGRAITKPHANRTREDGEVPPPNVVLLVLDSLSIYQGNAYLPETTAWLRALPREEEERLASFSFLKFHNAARQGGTADNMVPLFTGRRWRRDKFEPLRLQTQGVQFSAKNADVLLHQLLQRGYHTTFASECGTLMSQPFREPHTRFWRWILDDAPIAPDRECPPRMWRSIAEARKCESGGYSLTANNLLYAADLRDEANAQNKALFAYVHLSAAHNHRNWAGTFDEIGALMGRLTDDDNTVVLLMADHGSVPHQPWSYYHPMMHIVAPRAVLARHPGWEAALFHNQFALFTHMDLFETLQQLTQVRDAVPDAKHAASLWPEHRPQSLLAAGGIALNRTCAEAGLERVACVMPSAAEPPLEWEVVPEGTARLEVRWAALEPVEALALRKNSRSAACEDLVIDRLLSWEEMPYRHRSRPRTVYFVRATYSTTNGLRFVRFFEADALFKPLPEGGMRKQLTFWAQYEKCAAAARAQAMYCVC